MWKRFTITLFILLLVFGSIFTYQIVVYMMTQKYMTHFSMPAVVVSAEKAKATTWQPIISAVGSLSAVNGVNVTPEVSGNVESLYVDSGQDLKQGQPILKLRTPVLEADLLKAQAAVRLDQLTYNRDFQLYSSQAISKAQLDQDVATLEEDSAAVLNIQAQIEQHIVRAPFAGRIGIIEPGLGQYINPGDNIGTLEEVDSLYVDFPVTQEELSQIYVGMPVTFTASSYPDQTFHAKVTALDTLVSDKTRSLMVRAELKNTDAQHFLYPGTFVEVHALLTQKDNVVTIPQTAVVSTLYGDTVYVLHHETNKAGQPEWVAKQVYVTTGENRGDQIAIEQGVQVGDLVVTTGQVKIQNGSVVQLATDTPGAASDATTSSK